MIGYGEGPFTDDNVVSVDTVLWNITHCIWISTILTTRTKECVYTSIFH